MNELASNLRKTIEAKVPSAFTVHERRNYGHISSGIEKLDDLTSGIPFRALTEICGSNLASSGKTLVLMLLLAHATRDRYCALVDSGDSFDPISGQAAGINFSRLLWVRCGKSKVKLPPLEQAFKVADTLLQSNGFGIIVVDIANVSEKIVRRVPLSTWFRFSRVADRQSSALVFVGREPHATSCAALSLRISAQPANLSRKLFNRLDLDIEILRDRIKKPVRSTTALHIKSQWA